MQELKRWQNDLKLCFCFGMKVGKLCDFFTESQVVSIFRSEGYFGDCMFVNLKLPVSICTPWISAGFPIFFTSNCKALLIEPTNNSKVLAISKGKTKYNAHTPVRFVGTQISVFSKSFICVLLNIARWSVYKLSSIDRHRDPSSLRMTMKIIGEKNTYRAKK